MNCIKKYVCLSFFIIFFLTSNYSDAARGINVRPISPSDAEVKGYQWLFVIGIDTYIHWPRLKTAVNDAKSVKDILLSNYHFDKNHLIELYDEQATRKNILGKLRFLAKKVDQDDSLFIFFAGHGHLDSITKEGSWIPVKGGIDDASAWITNHDIKSYLRVDAIKAKHILLISDSCFSGDFFRGYRAKLPKVTDEVIKRAYKLTSRQAITSGGLEPVTDAGFSNNSVFSHFLVKVLRQNQKPFLIPSDFFADIRAGVVENADQFPQLGSLKDTGGQQGGEIVLFLRQDSRLEDLSVEAEEREKELERLKQEECLDSQIAFVSTTTGNKEIYIANFDGSNPKQFTNTGAITLSPTWSSDGKWLAYTSYSKGKPDLYIKHLKDKHVAIVAKKGINITPAWIPGKFALAASLSFSGDSEIYLLTGTGKIIKKLTNSGGVDVSPTFSPDCSKMAFVSSRSGSPQIYIMDLDSGQVERLMSQGRYNTCPNWSPRGDKIAYAGMRNGQTNIYTIDVEGESPALQLTHNSWNNDSPTWSPDGSMIAFSSTREGTSRIYVMTADGNDQRRLLSIQGEQTSPSWSPKLSND